MKKNYCLIACLLDIYRLWERRNRGRKNSQISIRS